jgi:transcriptional coactivator HFI1/ADA1
MLLLKFICANKTSSSIHKKLLLIYLGNTAAIKPQDLRILCLRVLVASIRRVWPLYTSSLQMMLTRCLDWDLEIRKRYAQPLASESGEFPDVSTVESRMLPICYETGLTSGHVQDAPHFMSVATETFIKEVLSSIFSKTRSNGPGAAGSAGTGGAATWVQTNKYRNQLEREEEAALRGELQRDKGGLLPIEAKAAGERRPLGMSDVRTALELGDCGLGQMPVVVQQILLGYREGEVEAWDDYSWPEGYERAMVEEIDGDIEMGGVNGTSGVNGHVYDGEIDEFGWEGGEYEDKSALDSLLDSCLAI